MRHEVNLETGEILELEDAPIIKPSKEDILNQKISEARVYLFSTDYKMTVDYFATLSKEIQDELILKRSEAREFIRLQKWKNTQQSNGN